MILTALRPFAPYIIGGLLVSHAGVYLVGRSHGAEAEQRAEAKRLAKAQKAVAKREKKADAITEKVSDKLTQERVRIEYRTRTIIERVPAYVSPASDAACSVPVGFVLLHNAAASGGSPGVSEGAGGSEGANPVLPPPEVLNAPSGVELSEVGETLTFNYGVALQWRAETLAWRDWWARQEAAWAKR